MAYQLHDYQNKLVNSARNNLAQGNRSVLLVSPAGSGKSVIIAEIARLATEKNGHVLFMVHRKELIEQITGSFLTNEVQMENTTIMTVGRIVNRLDQLPKPSLIITDETHHSLAKTYRDIYDYYADVPRLGFTASPWRMSGQGFTDVYESMVEGPQVEWLIENNFLAPYKYYSVNLIDGDKLKKSSTGDYTKNSIDDAIGGTIYGDVIQNYRKLADGKQAIVYCHSVDFSKEVAEAFRSEGIAAEHADAKTSKVEREKIMSDFRSGELKVLCNVDLISEGFNVPDCEVVILLRPTESLVLHIQQSMRSMRYKTGKRAIIIDHVANYMKHGLPDTPRKWTLEERERKGNKKTDSDAIPIKQCPQCMSVMLSNISICECGHEFIAEGNMEVEEAELVEITKDFTLQANYIVTKSVDELSTMEELKAYRKAKNYKPGWVYYQAKLKNII
ncbi:DEAD/DEAH box helicase [Jeotgalibaca porci]|uniref:DEAD/DEAH box helicase n=2 Tax=Jeotgalibaca porci TaxID=1868793 RepID=UPI0035A1BA82